MLTKACSWKTWSLSVETAIAGSHSSVHAIKRRSNQNVIEHYFMKCFLLPQTIKLYHLFVRQALYLYFCLKNSSACRNKSLIHIQIRIGLHWHYNGKLTVTVSSCYKRGFFFPSLRKSNKVYSAEDRASKVHRLRNEPLKSDLSPKSLGPVLLVLYSAHTSSW